MDAWSNSIRITKRTIRWRQRGQHDRCVVVLRIDFLLEKNDPARLSRTQDGAQENLISRVSALWPRLIRSTVIVSLNFDRDRSEEQRTKQRGRKRSLANKRERERERERENRRVRWSNQILLLKQVHQPAIRRGVCRLTEHLNNTRSDPLRMVRTHTFP